VNVSYDEYWYYNGTYQGYRYVSAIHWAPSLTNPSYQYCRIG
jgi:hypothetical protein